MLPSLLALALLGQFRTPTRLACDGGIVCTKSGSLYTVIGTPTEGSVPDATASVTGGVRLTGDLGGTATSPSVVDDSHAHTGDTLSNLDTADIATGVFGVGRGGTGVSTVSSNQVYVGTAADTLTAKTLPSCSNGTTDKLLYNNSTQTFSCGTDQTGGASSGPVRRTLTTGYTGTGTGTTAVAMPLFTWDGGGAGWNAVIDCRFMAITDGGTGNGIRFNVAAASLTATEVTRDFVYCSSATAVATIGNGTGFGQHAPTASQGGVPCLNTLTVTVRNVTAIGQVQFYMYSELASPNQVTVLPGSYCDYSGW